MKIKLVLFAIVLFAASLQSFTFNNNYLQQTELEDGEYFIVNVSTDDALTAVDVGVNSNTRIKDFKKSGLQKWTIKKRIVKSKNGDQVVYTIQHTASGFYLRPFFVPNNGNAIIAEKDNFCTYSITADGEHYVIKNIKMGGDALYVKDGGALSDEPWFSGDEENEKFRWQLISTTSN